MREVEAAMLVLAQQRVAEVKERHNYMPHEPYRPTESEYREIAAETGIAIGEIYTMFISP